MQPEEVSSLSCCPFSPRGSSGSSSSGTGLLRRRSSPPRLAVRPQLSRGREQHAEQLLRKRSSSSRLLALPASTGRATRRGGNDSDRCSMSQSLLRAVSRLASRDECVPRLIMLLIPFPSGTPRRGPESRPLGVCFTTAASVPFRRLPIEPASHRRPRRRARTGPRTLAGSVSRLALVVDVVSAPTRPLDPLRRRRTRARRHRDPRPPPPPPPPPEDSPDPSPADQARSTTACRTQLALVDPVPLASSLPRRERTRSPRSPQGESARRWG